ncbi:MAG: glycosyltransferase family 2 protein [Polyangiales bacterium]
MPRPLVSCLMVTRNRSALARRAVQCFVMQSWEPKELVIVDDGHEDYEPMLAPFREQAIIHYHRFAPEPGRLLGAARNLSLDAAHGDYVVQWDDDEWYHPERIERQMRPVAEGFEGSVLRDTLMHLDTPEYVAHLYRTGLYRGTPGTVLHRRTSVRYPNLRRGEDTAYLCALKRKVKLQLLPDSHLFIRCFHGSNTWESQHFVQRLWRNPKNLASFVKARLFARDLFAHSAFKLTPEERSAAARFLAESRALGVIAS